MSNRRLIQWIMLAVLAWGTLLAVGAYRYNDNPWRLVMVMSCVAGFLGFWLLMLWTRRAK